MDGTFLDSSVNGNHAVVDSSEYAAVSTSNRFSVVNRALNFDGVNDFARADASLTDPALNDGLTISVFIKADSISYGGENRIRPIVFKQKPEARSYVPQFMLALDGRSGTGRALFMLASTVALRVKRPAMVEWGWSPMSAWQTTSGIMWRQRLTSPRNL